MEAHLMEFVLNSRHPEPQVMTLLCFFRVIQGFGGSVPDPQFLLQMFIRKRLWESLEDQNFEALFEKDSRGTKAARRERRAPQGFPKSRLGYRKRFQSLFKGNHRHTMDTLGTPEGQEIRLKTHDQPHNHRYALNVFMSKLIGSI